MLEPMLAPYAGKLDIDPVARAVNSPRNDRPELIEVAS
jgi:putative SOS response-associated peptidase YedK